MAFYRMTTIHLLSDASLRQRFRPGVDEVLIIFGAFFDQKEKKKKIQPVGTEGCMPCFSEMKKHTLGKLFKAADSWGLSGSEMRHVNLCNVCHSAISEYPLFDCYETAA